MLCITFVMNAQNKEFNPYWYLQLQGGAGYTVGEAPTFMEQVSLPAAALNIFYGVFNVKLTSLKGIGEKTEGLSSHRQDQLWLELCTGRPGLPL